MSDTLRVEQDLGDTILEFKPFKTNPRQAVHSIDDKETGVLDGHRYRVVDEPAKHESEPTERPLGPGIMVLVGLAVLVAGVATVYGSS